MPHSKQFSLTAMFLAMGLVGLFFGFCTWFSKILPGPFAAVFVFIWFCGLGCVAYAMTIDVENNWRRGALQLGVASLGCLIIVIAIMLTGIVWIWHARII